LKDKTGQLAAEIKSNQLGDPHTMKLLKKLKPKFWFAGHMHAKFSAIYTHEDGSITRFLALDKCIPKRSFLQLLSLNENGLLCEHSKGSGSKVEVELDPEWLAILKVNNEAMPVPGRSGSQDHSLRGVTDA
jgi:lariat debranching enzyme